MEMEAAAKGIIQQKEIQGIEKRIAETYHQDNVGRGGAVL
jgi:hypothetical protein